MARIESPEPGFEGDVVGVTFVAGVGETTNGGALAYFRRHGYRINGQGPDAGARPVDARDVAGEQVVGSKLRDAAVDPRPGDFLPPTNAGLADPHGPAVVSPEIHASQGAKPVTPGKVPDAPAVQEAKETAAVVDAAEVPEPNVTEEPKVDPPKPKKAPAKKSTKKTATKKATAKKSAKKRGT